MKLSKKIKRPIYRYLLKRVYRDLLEEEFVRRAIASNTAQLGLVFDDGLRYKSLEISGLPSESGCIRGELAHLLGKYVGVRDKVLLTGEENKIKPVYCRITGVAPENVITAGLHDNMDYQWDYDNPPPDALPNVDVIVSQAMIEHITDPFGHLRHCYQLLNPGGRLIVHTVMPGFQYHRYPIDCQRFYPDWFEAAAARIGAEVAERILGVDGRIVYCLTKPAG